MPDNDNKTATPDAESLLILLTKYIDHVGQCEGVEQAIF